MTQKLADIVEPLGDRVGIKLKGIEERKSASGLWLSEGAKREIEGGNRPMQGEIFAVGPDVWQYDEQNDSDIGVESQELRVGDTVVFGKFSGVELRIGDDRVIMLRRGDIIARIKDPAAKVKVSA